MVKRCVNGQMCSPDNAFFLTLNYSVKYMANKSYIAIFSYVGWMKRKLVIGLNGGILESGEHTYH